MVCLADTLCRFSERYHPFFPIASAGVLSPAQINSTVVNEQFLLTAILMIASKDQSDMADLNARIWTFLKTLLLDVVLGMSSVRNVGCVEGLLLLGEWTPLPVQGLNDEGSEGAAWSILGLAVRPSYHLRLEESSFKGDNDNDPILQRRRLAWTCESPTIARGLPMVPSYGADPRSHISARPPDLNPHGPRFLVSRTSTFDSFQGPGLSLASTQAAG